MAREHVICLTGTFSVGFNDTLLFSDFSSTLSLCSSSDQSSYESAFFSLLQGGGQYGIYEEGDAIRLGISTPIFYNYVFGNVPLNTTAYNLKQTIVYPNPAKSKLFIESPNNVITKIEILNSLGQTVKTINDNFETIAIADLSSGIYLLKINTELGMLQKKIIKE